MYEDGSGREFGRYTFGWKLRPAFTFAAGECYAIRTKWRWLFGKRKPGVPTQAAAFYRDETAVMLLQSFVPVRLFSNEATARLEGRLATDLADLRLIAGLLIGYQTLHDMRNHHAG